MSPLSGTVLTGATIVASPALYASLVDQTMPLDVGLTRYLIAVGICWAVLSLVAELAFPAPGSVRPQANADQQSTPTAPTTPTTPSAPTAPSAPTPHTEGAPFESDDTLLQPTPIDPA